MKSSINLLLKLFRIAKLLGAAFMLLAVVSTVVSLHHSEAVENDGLTLCQAIDSEAETCQKSHQEDNDNDNETIRVLGDLDTLKQFQLYIPLPSTLKIPVPEYQNSYLFGFLTDLNRPPTSFI
jgi:hypothetical protein